MLRLLCLASALVMTLPAQAQVHKWVDANGKVQYSDQAPPGKAGVETLRVDKRTTPAPVAGTPADKPAAKSLADRELEYRQRQVAAEEAQKKQAQADAENKIKQENCAGARGNLKILEQGARVYNYDAKGERVYLDDAARSKSIDEAKKRVSEWCKQAPL